MNRLLKIGIIIIAATSLMLTFLINKKTGGGEIVYEVSGNDRVYFSHEFHVKNMKIGCPECHSDIFKMDRSNFTSYKKKDIEIMPLMEKGRFCGSCHNNSQAFTVSGNCALCHRYQ